MFDRHGDALVGVAVFAAPVSVKVLTSPFPTLEPYTQSMELARFALLGAPHGQTGPTRTRPVDTHEVPANGESWMLARVFRILHAEGVRGIVSFADPVPRTTLDGTIQKIGHWGVRRTLTLLPDGSILNARAAQKVRAQDQGHAYVERRLIAAGARPITDQDNPAAWLTEALTSIGARKLAHEGNHRYLFRLGPRREQLKIPLGMPTAPRPKNADPAL